MNNDVLEMKVDLLLAKCRIRSDVTQAMQQGEMNKNGPFFVDRNVVSVDFYERSLLAGSLDEMTVLRDIARLCGWPEPQYKAVDYYVLEGFLCSVEACGKEFVSEWRGWSPKLARNLAAATFLKFLGFAFNVDTSVFPGWSHLDEKQRFLQYVFGENKDSPQVTRIEETSLEDVKRTSLPPDRSLMRMERFFNRLVRTPADLKPNPEKDEDCRTQLEKTVSETSYSNRITLDNRQDNRASGSQPSLGKPIPVIDSNRNRENKSIWNRIKNRCDERATRYSKPGVSSRITVMDDRKEEDAKGNSLRSGETLYPIKRRDISKSEVDDPRYGKRQKSSHEDPNRSSEARDMEFREKSYHFHGRYENRKRDHETTSSSQSCVESESESNPQGKCVRSRIVVAKNNDHYFTNADGNSPKIRVASKKCPLVADSKDIHARHSQSMKRNECNEGGDRRPEIYSDRRSDMFNDNIPMKNVRSPRHSQTKGSKIVNVREVQSDSRKRQLGSQKDDSKSLESDIYVENRCKGSPSIMKLRPTINRGSDNYVDKPVDGIKENLNLRQTSSLDSDKNTRRSEVQTMMCVEEKGYEVNYVERNESSHSKTGKYNEGVIRSGYNFLENVTQVQSKASDKYRDITEIKLVKASNYQGDVDERKMQKIKWPTELGLNKPLGENEPIEVTSIVSSTNAKRNEFIETEGSVVVIQEVPNIKCMGGFKKDNNTLHAGKYKSIPNKMESREDQNRVMHSLMKPEPVINDKCEEDDQTVRINTEENTKKIPSTQSNLQSESSRSTNVTQARPNMSKEKNDIKKEESDIPLNDRRKLIRRLPICLKKSEEENQSLREKKSCVVEFTKDKKTALAETDSTRPTKRMRSPNYPKPLISKNKYVNQKYIKEERRREEKSENKIGREKSVQSKISNESVSTVDTYQRNSQSACSKIPENKPKEHKQSMIIEIYSSSDSDTDTGSTVKYLISKERLDSKFGIDSKHENKTYLISSRKQYIEAYKNKLKKYLNKIAAKCREMS